jgi:hypothetical protein
MEKNDGKIFLWRQHKSRQTTIRGNIMMDKYLETDRSENVLALRKLFACLYFDISRNEQLVDNAYWLDNMFTDNDNEMLREQSVVYRHLKELVEKCDKSEICEAFALLSVDLHSTIEDFINEIVDID